MRTINGFVAVVLGSMFAATGSLCAQTVLLDAPAPETLTTATPKVSVRVLHYTLSRPLRVTLSIGTTPDAIGLLDTTFTTIDTIFSVQVTRVLPSHASVYWQVRVSAPDAPEVSSAVAGPKQLPAWLTLVTPNSPNGDQFDTRRPKFVWTSARIDSGAGAWKYEIRITRAGETVVSSGSDFSDTTFTPPAELEANVQYRWEVVARLRTSDFVSIKSASTFFIVDRALPTVTALFQNFPNPFPTATTQSTCFWFDVGVDRTRVSLDIVDLRGNFVRRVVPALDGIDTFNAGPWGRGDAGFGSNCSNRFVWDGTSSNGRPVPPGVYLARFRVNGGAPTFKKIMYLGR